VDIIIKLCNRKTSTHQ